MKHVKRNPFTNVQSESGKTDGKSTSNDKSTTSSMKSTSDKPKDFNKESSFKMGSNELPPKFNFKINTDDSDDDDDEPVSFPIMTFDDNSNKNNVFSTGMVKRKRVGDRMMQTELYHIPNNENMRRVDRHDQRNYDLQNQVLKYRYQYEKDKLDDRKDQRNHEYKLMESKRDHEYKLLDGQRNYDLKLLEDQRNHEYKLLEGQRDHDYRMLEDKRNERDHEYRIESLNKIDKITKSRMDLAEQQFDHKMKSRKSMIKNPPRYNPLSNDKNGYDIIKAAEIASYDLRSNPMTMSVSDQFIENDLGQVGYSYSVLYSGVMRFEHDENKFKIYFMNNQKKPLIIKLNDGYYVKPVKSDIYPNVLLVRFFIIPGYRKKKYELCPCSDDCEIY